jgi:hypothetical protein
MVEGSEALHPAVNHVDHVSYRPAAPDLIEDSCPNFLTPFQSPARIRVPPVADHLSSLGSAAARLQKRAPGSVVERYGQVLRHVLL